MTEEKWLTSDDPKAMLDHLCGNVSGRKLRYFAAACSHRVIQVTTDDNWQMSGTDQFVSALERYADGLLSDDEWGDVIGAVLQKRHDIIDRTMDAEPADFCTILCAVDNDPHPAAEWSALNANIVLAKLRGRASATEAAGSSEALNQTSLLRDIFGNPFRPVVADPSWLTPTVTTLADAIYAERAFDRLPVLADALEEAGCDNADVLSHCRGPGQHVRGCWVVDLVLGKS